MSIMTKSFQQTTADSNTSLLSKQFVGAMKILGLDDDARAQQLGTCQAFYDGTQHDHSSLNWDGVPRDPGVGYLRERLKPQGFVPANVGMMKKKPDVPVPLCRQIVSRFTEMLLGDGRRPSIRIPSDDAVEDFLEAAFKASEMWDVLSEARDKAGACGAAAIVIGLTNGHLSGEVIHVKNLWVPMWSKDVPYWSPDMVVEQIKVRRQVQNKENGKLESKDVWQTRAWTAEEFIYYKDVLVGKAKDPEGEDDVIKIDYVRKHSLGVCPVIWYQNTRATDSPYGTPDCDPTWPNLDKLDRLQSQVFKAAIANTDPTLVVKEDRFKRRRDNIIRKGSDGVLALSTGGDAKYLEMLGTSVKVGMDAIAALTSQILQTTECVVIQPEHSKAFQSGEALQILWRSMEAKANRLRTPLSSVIRQVSRLCLTYAVKYGVGNIEDIGKDGEKKENILLPPRKIIEDLPEQPPTPPGELPEPTPEPKITWVAHEVDKKAVNSHIELEWPNYWNPTATQILAMANAMASSTGGKQIVSAETAARSMASLLNVDQDEEIRKLEQERIEAVHQTSLFGDFLDDDDDDDDSGKGGASGEGKKAGEAGSRAPKEESTGDKSDAKGGAEA